MQNQAEYLLVLTTCADDRIALDLANKLVDAKLVACVNIVPKIVSVYEWQGQKEQSGESLLMMKTTQAQYASLQSFIEENHPYELPEVIAVRICNGLPDYLAWISHAVK